MTSAPLYGIGNRNFDVMSPYYFMEANEGGRSIYPIETEMNEKGGRSTLLPGIKTGVKGWVHIEMEANKG